MSADDAEGLLDLVADADGNRLDEGTRRQALLWDGEWTDAIVMGLLHTDPRPAPDARA